MEDRIERLARVLDAAKAINREVPENLAACLAAGEGYHAVPLSLLVELREAIAAVRENACKPAFIPGERMKENEASLSSEPLHIHSRHTSWMHEVGYGDLCEEGEPA